MFLTADEIRTLTGRALKTHQIAALRAMGIAFFVNAAGRPVVTRVAVEGTGKPTATEPASWSPAIMQKRA
jgi:hypothetical protein